MAVTKQFKLEDSSGVKITGQAANLTFRISPYSSDIAGITFTEQGTTGIYVASNINSFYQDAKLYKSGVEQGSFGIQDIGDPSNEFLSKSVTAEQDIFSDIDMNSKKLKNLVDGSAAQDSATYGQSVKATGSVTENITGTKTFSTANPRLFSSNPSTDLEATSKGYVDALYGGAIGYQIAAGARLILPSRTTNIGQKVYKSLEEGASNIATEYIPTVTKRGVLLLQTVDTAAGSSILTPANVGWATAYIDLKSDRKAKINVSIASSYTIDMEIYNCHIIQDGTPTASFTNFKFINCIIEFTASNDVTFTTCHFDNCIIKSGGTLTLSNCKGRLVYCNATVTWNGSTKPLDVTDGADINNLGV